LDFDIQALYLQPNIESVNFRGIKTLPNNDLKFINYDPEYAWGVRLNGMYHFNKDYDTNLNYYHFNSTSRKSFGAITGNEAGFLSATNSQLQPSLNVINLEFGQTIYYSSSIFRLHAGAQFARIAVNGTDWVVFNNIENVKQTSRIYHGFGGRLGFLASYNWQNDLSVYSDVATAILTGRRSTTTKFSDSLPIQSRFESVAAITPELETRFGAKYTLQTKQNKFSLEGGWMWLHYFQAIFNDNFNLITNTPFQHDATSFGLQGPFVGIKWTEV